MNNRPIVTVITITRNRGNLIAGAINSVLNQTYNLFEYIIVDGASDDNTIEVVKSFNDQRIKLIELEENLSIPMTIDVAIKSSCGEYITFLDDDDEYLPEKIAKQLQLIQSLDLDYGFVYCWMAYYDKMSNSLKKIHHPTLKGDIKELVVEKPIVCGTPTLFFRREAFLKLGGWKEGIGFISDWELTARACQTNKVDYVPEVLVNVYENHGSVRMSNVENYYTELYQKRILFHQHFLSEFKEIFLRNPQRSKLHLYVLAKSFLSLGKWKEGFRYYQRLLKAHVSFKIVLLPVIALFTYLAKSVKKH